MRIIPKKNYIILVVLLAVTVLLTFVFSNFYKNKEKSESKFYQYANNISSDSFSQYVLESSDLIVYMADKYDLSYSKFEKKFIKKIDEYNMKNKLVYIDKEELDNKFIKELETNYGIKLNVKNLPIVLIISNNTVKDVIYVKSNSTIDKVIDFEAFEW